VNFRYFLYKHRTLICLAGIPLVSIAFGNIVSASSPVWTITSYFGELDDVHKIPHNGIDFAAPIGTPVDSIVDGTVTDIKHAGSRSWGTSVHIKDAQGREVIYGHLSEPKVHIGQQIHTGDLLALTGNTGRSTGPHLHIQININGKPIDPMRDIMRAAMGR
jgi:murein DD-endopeptidase MepM/ murein hydrolase activator NlpD